LSAWTTTRNWSTLQGSHAGIVLVPQQEYSIGEVVRRLSHLHRTLSAEEMQYRLVFECMGLALTRIAASPFVNFPYLARAAIHRAFGFRWLPSGSP
jgi:hypothetical protein